MKSTVIRARISAAFFALSALAMIWAATSPALAAVTLSPDQEKRLVASMNNSTEKSLLYLPGVSKAAAGKIMAYRASGKAFTSAADVRSVSGLNAEEYDKLAARFQKLLVDRGAVLSEATSRQAKKEDRQANALEQRIKARSGTGAAEKGEESTSGSASALNLEVRGKYYSILPGYDLSGLSDRERRTFLEAINTEMCPCGCRGETLGYCLVNDPGCMVVRARVKKIYKDVTGKEPPAGAGDSRP